MENGFVVVDDDEIFETSPEENGGVPNKPVSKEIFDWIDTIVIALVAVVLIFTFFFRIATIVGPSMQNTLYSGERVIISGFNYEPEYGDIVVISRNTNNAVGNVENGREPIIKRVIATEGQWVDIDFKKGVVYVGEDPAHLEPLNEPYTKTLTTRKWDIDFPVYVADNCVFVLGDNRNDSLDSRSSSIGDGGLVDKRYILGKAIYRIWPFDAFGGL